jgi:hypothetical protein
MIIDYINNSNFKIIFEKNKMSTYEMIEKVLDAPNIMDYENIKYFIAPKQNFNPFDYYFYKYDN